MKGKKHKWPLANKSSKIGFFIIVYFVLLNVGSSVTYAQDREKSRDFCHYFEEKLKSNNYSIPSGPYKANWQSLAKHTAVPEWFRDAKFGIYFHWGVYSVPAYDGEWYPRNMYIKGHRAYEHHVNTYGSLLEFEYADFVPMFKAENFDAEEWAELFKKAGAQFAGPVAEHHDGFAMWDSEFTPWNTADKGPKRDITGELAKAIREQGMKLVTTFHHGRNNLWKPEGEDWTGHYDHIKQDFPDLLDDLENAFLYGYIPREEFLQLWGDKLKEVINKYQPDLMWFDSWLDEIPDSVKMDYLAYYFNTAREWDKEVVVTAKQEDLPPTVGVKDFEKGRAGEILEHAFLTDDTISKGSWCYTQGLEIKSTSVVLHSLIDIVSKNGQLLLNISPKADGSIPENQKQVLLEIGDWLDINGEAIYGTRPWEVYGEGPTKLKAGLFEGFTDAGGYTPEDIRYTRKGNAIYAIVLGWPGTNQEVQLQSFARDSLNRSLSISGISMLGSDEEINWDLTKSRLVVQTPSAAPDPKAVVFKIVTD